MKLIALLILCFNSLASEKIVVTYNPAVVNAKCTYRDYVRFGSTAKLHKQDIFLGEKHIGVIYGNKESNCYGRLDDAQRVAKRIGMFIVLEFENGDDFLKIDYIKSPLDLEKEIEQLKAKNEELRLEK